jgi:hypothetical protein
MEVLSTASPTSYESGQAPSPQDNRNGWVNAEDLPPMPQCIAQQDQSAWLSTMTRCTGKQCTRHFGVICTAHDWLVQLSCLSTSFSPDVIKGYFPYCSRSVLAKAQLYSWVRSITGRTWLVDVGDAVGLEDPSPSSLTRGYTTIDATFKAPTCLTRSVSVPSKESFQHVMTSCSFGATTQRIGNDDRPWVYDGSQDSIIALEYETVGYDLTHRYIGYGDYFDKECFCGAFIENLEDKPCSDLGRLEITKERLWINAICGPASLPRNWRSSLQTTGFAYIPTEDWRWPTCVMDMPKQVIKLTDQCATDACELDSSGYCKVKRAVDRACFCHGIRYDTCGGTCQTFETRIDYVNWLHKLCGNVQDWNGLPENWRNLTNLSPLELIPWEWTITPSDGHITLPIADLGPVETARKCASTKWKRRVFALINLTTALAVFLSRGKGMHQYVRSFTWHPHPWGWVLAGISIVALQLVANWINAFLIQETPGYEDVPLFELMVFWCTMPRLTWLPILLVGIQPFEAINFSAAASSLLAEMILHTLSSYHMIATVYYGIKHDFYLGSLEDAKRGSAVKTMYVGALLWLVVILAAFVAFLRAVRRMNRLTRSGTFDSPEWRRNQHTTSNVLQELMVDLDERFTWLGEKLAHHWLDQGRTSHSRPLLRDERGSHTLYGTLPAQIYKDRVPRRAFAKLYAVTIIGMSLLWIAQWTFWNGFIGVSLDE